MGRFNEENPYQSKVIWFGDWRQCWFMSWSQLKETPNNQGKLTKQSLTRKPKVKKCSWFGKKCYQHKTEKRHGKQKHTEERRSSNFDVKIIVGNLFFKLF